MKHLTSSYSSSSSSSPSSSSILSFGSKSATAGCLSAIMHRILCSGGLTTHSSDQITELDSMQRSNVQELKAKQNTEAAATSSTNSTPGNLVARLMGLDLNVEIPSEVKNSTSLSRSKSMNSVDYFGECKQLKGHKSSSSFHEVPTFHLLENENFLVLSFEGGRGESKEFKYKGRKNEKGHAELKQKQRERGELKKRNKREKVYEEKKKGNLSKRLCDIMSSVNVGNDGELENNANTSQKGYLDTDMVSFSQSLKCKEVPNGGKVKKRKKNRTTCYTEKKTETECSSEDSSPVSVFDFERQAPGTGLHI
ncbi:hypothetical protein RIF29_17129 [Crotalaria pallida]|uniref:DUF3741 domain-containing protein n=1 Tax=Crotalaria pallida TaxID=3830 RepID=A0AAN9FGR4_CROPI